LPNWKLANTHCANFGNIKPVMAQTSTNFSNSTKSTAVAQILMVGASIGLHYVVASNLGLFGRLDPVILRPTGGTVKVVDLTPAEQTRVPEAAKSRPLPIDPVPANPEPATRTPANPTNPGRSAGASTFTPPNTSRPQFPPPSTQFPRPPFNQNPRQPPSPQQQQFPFNNNDRSNPSSPQTKPPQTTPNGSEGGSDQGNDSGIKKSIAQRKNPASSTSDSSTSSAGATTKPPSTPETNTPPKGNDGQGGNDSPTSDKRRKIEAAISSLQQNGQNLITVEVPQSLQKKSSCEKYEDVEMLWPIKESGDLDLQTIGSEGVFTQETVLPDDRMPGKQREQAKKIVLETHAKMTASQKQQLINQYKPGVVNKTRYSFRIPNC
jgi:hypothetical protein